MKKILLTALCAILGVCAYAQKGSNTIGVNILYNTQVTESAGLGIKAQHFFTTKAGTRNISCLDKLRNMLTVALPIDWKKLVITICAPIMMNIAMM